MKISSQPLDLSVRGDLVMGDEVVKDGILGIRDGRIAAIFTPPTEPPRVPLHDFSGHQILPGLVDTHVHTLSSATEGMQRATAAAAAGGVTTIVDMPFDATGPVISRARLEEKVESIGTEAFVDVGLYGTMPAESGLSAIGQLADRVLAFKFSLCEYDRVRFPRISDGDLLAAFELLAPGQLPIVLHAELQEVIESRLKAFRGAEESGLLHGLTHPIVSETGAIAKAMEFALMTGARVHVAHVTHPHGFNLIDWYRRLGAKVTGETCVHYLTLTEEDDVVPMGGLAKINPPIRDREAREGLWRMLPQGLIASVSTDHVAWPLEKKQLHMLNASAGIPGLETFFAAFNTEASRRGYGINTVVEMLCTKPAAIFGLDDRKGALAIGLDADLAIVDPNEDWEFDAAESQSSAKWSPYQGRRLHGRVIATFLRGKPIYMRGRLLGNPGEGRLLPARKPAERLVAS